MILTRVPKSSARPTVYAVSVTDRSGVLAELKHLGRFLKQELVDLVEVDFFRKGNEDSHQLIRRASQLFKFLAKNRVVVTVRVEPKLVDNIVSLFPYAIESAGKVSFDKSQCIGARDSVVEGKLLAGFSNCLEFLRFKFPIGIVLKRLRENQPFENVLDKAVQQNYAVEVVGLLAFV